MEKTKIRKNTLISGSNYSYAPEGTVVAAHCAPEFPYIKKGDNLWHCMGNEEEQYASSLEMASILGSSDVIRWSFDEDTKADNQ